MERSKRGALRGVCGVSAEYRQKLVNWLTSMLVLLLITVVASLYEWLRYFTYIASAEYYNPEWFLGVIVGALGGYSIYFVFLWFWHFADFVQQMTWTNRILAWLMGYPLLVSLLLLIGASNLFVQSGWLDDLGCPQIVTPPEGPTFSGGCGSPTPWWKELIGIALVFALLFVSFSKLLVVLAFHATQLSRKALSLLQSDGKNHA